MRERKIENTRKNACQSITSGVIGLFKPESKEEKWKKLNHELKQHLGSIYYKIEEVSENSVVQQALRAAFFEHVGLDSLDAFRDEIARLNAIHRSSVSNCERCCETCGGIAVCLCNFLMVVNYAVNKQLLLDHLLLKYPDYENPRHSKSPYSALATAVSDYAVWYSKIPKCFTDGSIESMNISKACVGFKREHLFVEIIVPTP